MRRHASRVNTCVERRMCKNGIWRKGDDPTITLVLPARYFNLNFTIIPPLIHSLWKLTLVPNPLRIIFNLIEKSLTHCGPDVLLLTIPSSQLYFYLKYFQIICSLLVVSNSSKKLLTLSTASFVTAFSTLSTDT